MPNCEAEVVTAEPVTVVAAEAAVDADAAVEELPACCLCSRAIGGTRRGRENGLEEWERSGWGEKRL